MRLTVETGPLAGTVVSLDRDQPTTLGSAPECALRVQEPGVLPHHAVVKALRDQGFGIKALGPGVRVNGSAIEASPLQDGDRIEIGTTRIAFGQVQKRGLPKIPGYRILDELGRGGMGMVYRAEQTSLHREVALKVLNQELTKDPQFVGKFVAEARAAAKLQHPNVVQVFDVEHDEGTYYYAMELMQEGSLEDWLKQNGVMPVDRALRVVADAAAGLAYAESLGIVHRDIKPDNLMLDQHGAVKIADLGLAGTDVEAEEKAVGTPHFMAPEQVLRKAIDHRSDLYALGCTFYRLVTGRTPFRGQTVKDILRAQVKDDAEPANKANPQVPAEVAAIIAKLMQKEPQNRFQTANDLLEELNLLLQPPAKKGLWIGLAAAAVLVAGGAIYWAVNKPKEQTIVEKYRDNPEMLKLATENEELKKAAREQTATIALLTVRLSGQADRELASALDRVAADHAGTAAAGEATERASGLRRSAEDRERQLQQRRTMLGDHLAGLGQAIKPQLQAHDYAAAMATLAAAPPAALKDEPELRAGLDTLRASVVTAAGEQLAALKQRIAAARDGKDPAALVAATDAFAEAIANPARWPDPMRAQLAEEKRTVDEARASHVALQREAVDSLWQRYHGAVLAGDGVVASLRGLDFTAAALAAANFAKTASDDVAGAHATGFAAAAELAAVFAAALERAAAGGQVVYRTEDGPGLTVLRWDRKGRQLVLTPDATRKPPKEQPLPTGPLGPEAWAALAEQVAPPVPGSRECFLGMVALVAHADAGRQFLSRLRADDDTSGTGAAAYPLGANLFEQLQRRLPENDQLPWVRSLRGELLAGQRLAAGLRALSARCNLAAAGHLDKLLAEHPHSLVVLTLQ